MGIERFEDLQSWQEARKLVQVVGRLTDKVSFRRSHLYIALDREHAVQAEFEKAYQQAEVVARLLNGALDNLDRQIARRSSEKGSPRRKSR